MRQKIFSSQTGIETETTNDQDGNKNITSIEASDFIEYEIIAPDAGEYTLGYRLFSSQEYIGFEVSRENSLIDKIEIPASGNWETISSRVELPFGRQKIKIKSNSSGWKLNWINFTKNLILQNVQNLTAVSKGSNKVALSWSENIADE